MKKSGLVVVLMMMGTLAVAQWGTEDLSENPTTLERLYTGGGIGGGFSTYYAFVSASPLIGYNITNRLAGGVQFTYRYTNYRSFRPSISTNDYAMGPFLRFKVAGPFFVHGEYEFLNYDKPNENVRGVFNSLLLGAGIFQPVAPRAGYYIAALYNFSYTSSNTLNSPYASPLVLRVGFTFGFKDAF
ncbi:MAG: hypothetical protein ABIS36_08115 [Chryseolinea sp.]